MTVAIICLAVVILALIARDAWLRTLADRVDARTRRTSENGERIAALEQRLDAQAKEVAAASKKASDAMGRRLRA